MRQITTTTDIEATPDRIWKVLMDFDAYPEWNPFVVGIEGTPAEGERLTVHLAPPGKKPARFRPTVMEVSEGRAFEWLGSVWFKGVFDGRHRFEITPTETGARFDHSERFSGILRPIVLRLIGEQTTAGFEAMNAALKERAEG